MGRARTKEPKKPFMAGYKTYDTSEGFGSAAEWRENFKERLGVEAATKIVGKNTPRSIVGVDETCASWEDIKSAFRKAVMKHHPDRGGDPAEFRKVYAAYELLETEFRR